MPAPLSPTQRHPDVLSLLRQAFGKEVRLEDRGIRGRVDPGDLFVYRNQDGKLVRTRLGKTRHEQAQMQLHVMDAARSFAEAGVGFAAKGGLDRVNQKLWWVKFNGEMGVRMGVRPSEALNDIFENGDQYAMECATATMVILYKAILERIGPEDFDRAFARTRLFRWEKKDDDFLAAERVGDLPGFWPGDHTYFRNPEYDPSNSAFQGENVIYLGNGEYFGHGIGIVTEAELVKSLNGLRREGATKSAHRDDDFELRLDGREIAKLDLHPDR